jgi:hypothetical protein
MDFLGPVHRFDDYQQKSKWLALPMAVVKKFGDDQGGNLAALLAYYAFLSVFPLLLVFTTILAYALHGNPACAVLQRSISGGEPNPLAVQLAFEEWAIWWCRIHAVPTSRSYRPVVRN